MDVRGRASHSLSHVCLQGQGRRHNNLCFLSVYNLFANLFSIGSSIKAGDPHPDFAKQISSNFSPTAQRICCPFIPYSPTLLTGKVFWFSNLYRFSIAANLYWSCTGPILDGLYRIVADLHCRTYIGLWWTCTGVLWDLY